MSKKDDTISEEDIARRSELPVTVLAQYIRDLSFENPNTPDSLKSRGDAPDMDVNIGMDARKVPDDEHDNMYEVILSARAEAKMKDSDPLFILELQYGMAVLVDAVVPEENVHPLLLIEMPRLMFPYVRSIVSTVTSDGGFPPLFLSPVDFQALYMQRFAKEISEARAAMEEKSVAGEGAVN